MKVAQNLAQLVGGTPLLKLNRFVSSENLTSNIYAKLEYFNPSGSVKDRIARSMIEQAERLGKLKRDSVIIEPTSGNTGIGLAAIGRAKGYRVIIVMPETMSIERRKLMKAVGAELVLTSGTLGMQGAIDKAKELVSTTKNSFMPSQFENEANPQAHRETTGPEIWKDLDGKVDILVAGVGTGGTITGVGEYLKSQKPEIQIVAVEPESSAVLSGKNPGAHRIQGIGAGFVPDVLNTDIYDRILPVSDQQAFSCGRKLAAVEGLMVGISSGAALSAASKIAKEQKGKNIVVIFPDTGERYLSTPLYQSR